jgi:creatinine amidohydrolase
MHLAEATWPDVDDLATETDLAILPVGSTEQHGPHAPLGTDRYAATAVAEAATDRFDGEIALAPTIPVGISEEHRQFAGTLWVAPDTFRSYLRDVLRSLAHHGFDRIVVVNGHGGNIEALGEVCRRVTRGGDAFAVPFTWFEAVGTESVEIGHAGPIETAVLRHLHPTLVREDRIEDAADGAAAAWGEWVGPTNLAVDTAEFSENGTVGDPREGDAAMGESLISEATGVLVRLLGAVESR